jgi:hypothetical protein
MPAIERRLRDDSQERNACGKRRLEEAGSKTRRENEQAIQIVGSKPAAHFIVAVGGGRFPITSGGTD